MTTADISGGAESRKEEPLAALKDAAPLAVVAEEPAVLLLALPVMQAETELFDSPPEPALLLLKQVSPKDSLPITSTLIDFPRKDETVVLLHGGLPEPFLPEPEVAVKEVVAEEAGGGDKPAVHTPATPKPAVPKPAAPEPGQAAAGAFSEGEVGQAAVTAFPQPAEASTAHPEEEKRESDRA